MDTKERLGMAVAFEDIAGLRQAHKNGADLNDFFEDGCTPLTEAILRGMGSPKVVRELIKLGANPNQADKNGWTPWVACCSRLHDIVIKDEQEEIQAILSEANADKNGEELVRFWRCACDGDEAGVRAYLQQGLEPNSDLLGLLDCAVIGNHQSIVELLLNQGAAPDGNGDPQDLTPLIHAASNGNLEIVELLVQAGANINHVIDGEGDAEAYAREAGHEEVAEWLRQQKEKQPSASTYQAPPPASKFSAISKYQTSAINYNLSSDDIINRLESWDNVYGIEISEVDKDRLIVHFKTLPNSTESLDVLVDEIYAFCPDIIDQNFGCMDDIVHGIKESGQELSGEIAELVEGVDFNDENFGKILLRKYLQSTKSVGLWWD